MKKEKGEQAPKPGTAADPQGVLTPMSAEEVTAAGRDLAGKVEELRKMKTQHAGRRSEMKKEREGLQKDIDRVAGTIRHQGR